MRVCVLGGSACVEESVRACLPGSPLAAHRDLVCCTWHSICSTTCVTANGLFLQTPDVRIYFWVLMPLRLVACSLSCVGRWLGTTSWVPCPSSCSAPSWLATSPCLQTSSGTPLSWATTSSPRYCTQRCVKYQVPGYLFYDMWFVLVRRLQWGMAGLRCCYFGAEMRAVD